MRPVVGEWVSIVSRCAILKGARRLCTERRAIAAVAEGLGIPNRLLQLERLHEIRHGAIKHGSSQYGTRSCEMRCRGGEVEGRSDLVAG